MNTLDVEGLQSLLRDVGYDQFMPSWLNADPIDDVMDVFASCLTKFLVGQTGLSAETALKCLQWPNELGDVIAVLPRLRLKGLDVRVLAEELAEKFPESRLFAQPFADDFNLRFMFLEETLGRLLVPFILDRGPSYGLCSSGSGHEPNQQKKVIVEFSSPNIGREFDGNHLRSTFVGEYLARMHDAMGWHVVRMNFLGDWGKHIGVLAGGWARFGSDEDLETAPQRHLLEIAHKTDDLMRAGDPGNVGSAGSAESASGALQGSRKEIDTEKDAFCKALEHGSIEALMIWKRLRDAAVAEYKKLYARINICFDVYSGESEVSIDSMAEVEDALTAARVYELSNGAWIVRFPKQRYPGLGIGIARYRNGTTSYLLRDIAAVLDRNKQFGFDKMLYVVAARQDSHFRQVFACLELMGREDLVQKVEHVSFGPVNGLTAPDESSGLLLDGILEREQLGDLQHIEGKFDDQQGRAMTDDEDSTGRGNMPEAADLVTHILSGKRASAVSHEPRGMMATRGRTGHTLYSCFARLDQLIGPVALPDIGPSTLRLGDETQRMAQVEYVEMLRHLIHFPSVVRSADRSMESSGLVAYLFKLVDLADVALTVASGPRAAEASELSVDIAFFKAVRQVLVNGMTLLGLRIEVRTVVKIDETNSLETQLESRL